MFSRRLHPAFDFAQSSLPSPSSRGSCELLMFGAASIISLVSSTTRRWFGWHGTGYM